MHRRDLMKISALSLAGVASLAALAKTPAQVEGPFHPLNIDNDLRRLRPDSPFATGMQIWIAGVVKDDASGNPVRKAQIEIWQADSQGKYNHPEDPLNLTPDPNFQFWGRVTTDEQGRYEFFSIKPGSYPAEEGWDRPPHIHFRILKRGYLDLTTQMYFAGETLNDKDRILQRLKPKDQKKLIVSLNKDQNSGLQKGTFDIELEKV